MLHKFIPNADGQQPNAVSQLFVSQRNERSEAADDTIFFQRHNGQVRIFFQHTVGQRLDLAAIHHLHVDAFQRQRIGRDHCLRHHRTCRKKHCPSLVRQTHDLPRALFQPYDVVHGGTAGLGIADHHRAVRMD